MPLHLFLLLIFLDVVLGRFTHTTSQPVQCGQLAIEWSADEDQLTNPPYEFLLVPIRGEPLWFPIPSNRWNATTRRGSYVLDALPLRAGTQFVSSMDDGEGNATGGVSVLQTVQSGDTSCLDPESESVAPELLSLSSTTPEQCSTMFISWDARLVNLGYEVRGFVPGGTGLTLDPIPSVNVQTDWEVNIADGTQFILILAPLGEGPAMTSDLLTVTGIESDDCMSENSASTTANQGSTASYLPFPNQSSASGESSDQSRPMKRSTKAGIITGAVLGGLAVLAAIVFTYMKCTRSRARLQDQEPGYKTPLYNATFGDKAPTEQGGFVPILPSQRVHATREARKHPNLQPVPYPSGSSDSHSARQSPTELSPASEGTSGVLDIRGGKRSRTGHSQATSEPSSQSLPGDQPDSSRGIVRHVDAGPLTEASEGSVVELPPLYEDVGRRSAARSQPKSQS